MSQLQHLPWMQSLTSQIFGYWKEKKLPQAICLQGCEGLGKRHHCEFLASVLFCEQPQNDEPCGQCRQCILFANREHPDYLVLGLTDKGGKIGIDQIRSIADFASGTAYFAPMRLIVIEPLEQMTVAASNALLKLLEEPPPNVYFILASSKVSQLMPTIRSRIQFYVVTPPDEQQYAHWVRNCASQYSISLPEQESQQMLRGSYVLAQQGPLKGLRYLVKAADPKITSIPGLPGFTIDPKQPDLLREFERFFEVMSQSDSAIRTHLNVTVNAISIKESLLFYELWMRDQQESLHQCHDFSTDGAAYQQVEVLWLGFNDMQATQESLVRSPQLNVSYLKKALVDQWMLIIERMSVLS